MSEAAHGAEQPGRRDEHGGAHQQEGQMDAHDEVVVVVVAAAVGGQSRSKARGVWYWRRWWGRRGRRRDGRSDGRRGCLAAAGQVAAARAAAV